MPSFLVRKAYSQFYEVPFSSVHKYAYCVSGCPGDPSHHLAMMKGAPEVVLGHCSHHLLAGEVGTAGDLIF